MNANQARVIIKRGQEKTNLSKGFWELLKTDNCSKLSLKVYNAIACEEP